MIKSGIGNFLKGLHVMRRDDAIRGVRFAGCRAMVKLDT